LIRLIRRLLKSLDYHFFSFPLRCALVHLFNEHLNRDAHIFRHLIQKFLLLSDNLFIGQLLNIFKVLSGYGEHLFETVNLSLLLLKNFLKRIPGLLMSLHFIGNELFVGLELLSLHSDELYVVFAYSDDATVILINHILLLLDCYFLAHYQFLDLSLCHYGLCFQILN